MSADPYADIRHREQLDDPLPEVGPNCLAAFVVIVKDNGDADVHAWDPGFSDSIRPAGNASLGIIESACSALVTAANRRMLVEDLVAALDPKSIGPVSVADVSSRVVDALAARTKVEDE